MKQPIDLEGIRAREQAATPGPWEASEVGCWVDGKATEHWMRIADMRGWGHLTGKGFAALGLDDETAIAIQNANAEFIAHARQDIPALLDEVERLQGLLDGLSYCGNCGAIVYSIFDDELGECERCGAMQWRGFSEREGG